MAKQREEKNECIIICENVAREVHSLVNDTSRWYRELRELRHRVPVYFRWNHGAVCEWGKALQEPKPERVKISENDIIIVYMKRKKMRKGFFPSKHTFSLFLFFLVMPFFIFTYLGGSSFIASRSDKDFCLKHGARSSS